MDEAKNFAKGTLTQGYDDAATSIVLTAGDGARFPGAPFNAVWWNASDYPDPADDPLAEIVRVTAKSTDTFTRQPESQLKCVTLTVSERECQQ